MTNNPFYSRAQAMRPYLSGLRRDLHRIPETRFPLPETVSYVCGRLTEYGIPYRVIENGGIVALIGPDKEGPTFLLRADMDALPVREESGEPFSSQNGNMHACGHDLHTAMLLGAARLLKEDEARLPGSVKLVFQEDEEGVSGMDTLVRGGMMENPKAGAGMALHVMPGDLYTGRYYMRAGNSTMRMDTYRITVRGRGAHGAMPQLGIDPVGIAAHIVISLQEIVAREVPALEPVVLTTGSVRTGTAANVIPDTAVIEGSMRSCTEERSEMLRRRIREISTGVCAAFRAGCEVEFPTVAPVCVNDEGITALIGSCAASLGMERVDCDRTMVSEDFGIVTQLVPSALCWIGAGGPEAKYAGGVLHGARTCFNEDVLPLGAALLAMTAEQWLERNGTAE